MSAAKCCCRLSRNLASVFSGTTCAFDADVTFAEVDLTEKSNLRIQYKRNE